MRFEGDLPPVRRPRRATRDGLLESQLPQVGPIAAADPDFAVLCPARSEGDPGTVGGVTRVEILPRGRNPFLNVAALDSPDVAIGHWADVGQQAAARRNGELPSRRRK